MADIGRMRAFLRDHLLDGTKFDFALYGDESSVDEAPTLSYRHGKNIPWTALVCAYRAGLLKQPQPKPFSSYRDGVILYLNKTGLCHGEEFSRIYTLFHLDGVLWVRDLASKYKDNEVFLAADDWLVSFAGLIGLTTGPRRCGEKDSAKFDPVKGPHVMPCVNSPKTGTEQYEVNGSVQFGKRSWKRYSKDKVKPEVWIHLDRGYMYDSVKKGLAAVPASTRNVVQSAINGDPVAIGLCWDWFSARLPNVGKRPYALARWTGGLAFWSPVTESAQTNPGVLATIQFRPNESFDLLTFAGGYKGYSGQYMERYNGKEPTVTCGIVGDEFVVRGNWPDSRWPLRVKVPSGEQIFRFEFERGVVTRSEIKGQDIPYNVPVFTDPQEEVPNLNDGDDDSFSEEDSTKVTVDDSFFKRIQKCLDDFIDRIRARIDSL